MKGSLFRSNHSQYELSKNHAQTFRCYQRYVRGGWSEPMVFVPSDRAPLPLCPLLPSPLSYLGVLRVSAGLGSLAIQPYRSLITVKARLRNHISWAYAWVHLLYLQVVFPWTTSIDLVSPQLSLLPFWNSAPFPDGTNPFSSYPLEPILLAFTVIRLWYDWIARDLIIFP